MKVKNEIKVGDEVRVTGAEGVFVVEEWDGPNWFWASDDDGAELYFHQSRVEKV